MEMAKIVTPTVDISIKKARLKGVCAYINIIIGIILIVLCIVMSSIVINQSKRLLRQENKRLFQLIRIISIFNILGVLPVMYIINSIIFNRISELNIDLVNWIYSIMFLMYFVIISILSILQVWTATMIPDNTKELRKLRSLIISSSFIGILGFWWWILNATLGAFTINLLLIIYFQK